MNTPSWMAKRALLFSLAAFVLAFCCCPGVRAQNAQGSIVGHVVDPTGAIIPGAKVTVTNTETGISHAFTSTGNGDFVFVNLNPGTYQVTVDAAGFKSAKSSVLTLEVDQTLRQNFTLEIGEATQQVEVNAQAQMLQTDNETTGQVIQGDMIEKLPLNGRDFTNLLQIGVGTTITPGGIENTGYVLHGLNPSFQEVSVNGAHADSISYSVDGITDTDFFFSAPTNIPNELAIQEFKTENGQYGAQYGQGSVQVNVAVKSGTNQFHGAAYDFLRNDIFQPDNAQTVALNQLNGTNTPANLPFKQNQFGGTLGGPLTIPHFYNGSDKTFWFFAYDGGRRHQGQVPTSIIVPTADEKQGNFSDWPFPIYDPLTTGTAPKTTTNPSGRTAFANNIIPSDRIDSTASKLLQYFNAPNTPSCTDLTTGCKNFSASVVDTVDTDTEVARLDQNFHNYDHVFFTGIISVDNVTNPSVKFGQSGLSFSRSRLFGLTWDHTFNANTINQATLGYDRQHFYTGQTTAGGSDLATNAGFANSPNIPAYYDLPSVCFQSEYDCIGGSNPYEQWDNIYQGVDTLTLIRGRQTMNFGIDFRRVNLKDRDSYNAMGTLNFNGQYTASDPSDAGQSYSSVGPYEGNSFADFLLGQTQSAGGPPPLGSDLYWLWGNNWNVFFQDDIRATSNLTLNVGLRWERPTSFHSIDNSGYAFLENGGTNGKGALIWANSNFTSPILAAGGNPNYLECCTSNQLVHLDTKDFAPRIGLAYRPPATDKMVIRAGYGLFYDTYNRFYDGTQFDENSLYNLTAAPYTSTTGYETQSTAVVKNLWGTPLTADQGFSLPSYEAPFGQVYWPGNHNPYNQQWSLDVQYALTPTLMLDTGYVGSHGVHEATQLLINVAYQPTVAGDPCNGLLDASLATGSSANCATDPNFQPIDTRQIWSNLPPTLYANANLLNSSYNSLQVQLIQRPLHGLQYHLNYTYSKNMDESSGINNITGEDTLLQDPHHIGANYGLSAADQTHRVVATYTYELPAGQGHFLNVKNFNWLLGGWTTSGIYQIASGFPFAVYGGVSQDQTEPNDWTGRYLANRVSSTNAHFHSTLTEAFDTSQFATPELGRYGNAGKAPERTPYFANFDASFGKDFAVTERQHLLYRAEIFNLGSTWHSSTSLLEPDATVTDSTFGSLLHSNPLLGNTNLFNPRIIQMGLQYTF
jgi:hypothetical protein